MVKATEKKSHSQAPRQRNFTIGTERPKIYLPKKARKIRYHHHHNRHCIFSLSRTRTFSLSPFASHSLHRASSERSSDLRYAAGDNDDSVPEALPGVGIGNMSDILARRFGSATDGVGVGVGIWRDSLPCARRI